MGGGFLGEQIRKQYVKLLLDSCCYGNIKFSGAFHSRLTSLPLLCCPAAQALVARLYGSVVVAWLIYCRDLLTEWLLSVGKQFGVVAQR